MIAHAVGRSIPAFISTLNEDGANIKINSSFEAENRRYRFDGKKADEYVREQQTLDREERAAWRDTQKR